MNLSQTSFHIMVIIEIVLLKLSQYVIICFSHLLGFLTSDICKSHLYRRFLFEM